MDRRSWPWKKKSSEKSPVTPARSESSITCSSSPRLYNDQDLSVNCERGSDDVVTRWQKAEQKLRNVNEKLATALSENIAKDNLVEQHTKVAEEAVCGWEKAEAEAAALKLQLETTLHDKLAIDGALKECMRQLRTVREEQDQKLRDTVLKNGKEWDKVRSEFEAKLAGKDQQLAESGAQNEGLSRSLRERSRNIAELSNAKAQVETELTVLQMSLKTMEKENASLKYELQVLSKEFDIRNEERQYSKKELDSTNKQLLESTKKIAKLEAECQKLRVLVRRKLPGPAALAQMKLEVESVCSETGDRYKRRSSNRNSSPYGGSPFEFMQQRLQNGDREIETLTERMYAMEEESKLLREVLAQRNNELHAARLLCARTATKLSTVEARLEADSHCSGVSGARMSVIDVSLNGSKAVRSYGAASVVSLSDGSINDDEASCADAWASALVSELHHLKKDSTVLTAERPSNLATANLMDDFAEMEQLALTACHTIGKNVPKSAEKKGSAFLEEFVSREKELQAVNQICAELRSKLALTEKQLIELQKKNAVNETALVSLQEKLQLKFGAHGEGTVSMDKHMDRDASVNSEFPKEFEDASKKPYLELQANIFKVVGLLEEIGRALGEGFGGSPVPPPIHAAQEQEPMKSSKATDSGLPSPRNHSFDESIKKVNTLSNKFLEGKTGFKEYLQELSSILGVIKRLVSSFVGMSVERMSVPHDQNKQLLDDLPSDVCNCSENCRFKIEKDRIKIEKDEIEKSLKVAHLKIEDLTVQFQSSEKHVTELQDANASSQLSKQLLEEQLASLRDFRDNSESQLKSENALVISFQQKLATLEVELQDEHRLHQDAVAKIQQLQHQLDRTTHEAELPSSKATGSEGFNQDAEHTRVQKEQKITAAVHRLADCQRTIFVLGEQLKALSCPADCPENILVLKTDQESSTEKVSKSVEPAHCQTEEMQKTLDATEFPLHSERYKASPAYGYLSMNTGQDFEQSPWTPPQHLESSPYLRRGQLGSPRLERAYDRQEKFHQGRKQGLVSPARSEHSYVPTSPTDAYKFSTAMSPARFLTTRKKASSANDLSKAFNAVSTRASLEKHGSSGFSKFFSRTKHQLT
ncbi:hypothetical protein O6H91_05G030700 [Diphasiastrum complanatum]|uniref:Uncharacterized protein n=5 Tax=Diphasiastrum complanatum TaxID=34168 RepID=A0ACC2DMA1_DIPCM|nr:hypothetical protein O6H91_05G030700 [Diphasiastrum complanatum]KAJ7555295.1 hypothetical protein O6H91_05G030700 [Diphasiastrum complanatum]KAJ7555296.1 hypothetical protein O6H91_05G030700 [Diphasiastrum complanatum]KAJ7555297.1 hypothetical protein O6H91_05G030700 [Diphasiastrum complanatum]KAJ7555298.1 hypothetical protein O6H91_05G030700 [Diphasiastrum complanatum]